MSPFWNQADLQSMLEQTGGVAITLGGVTTLGLVDVPEQQVLPGNLGSLVGTLRVVRIETDSLPGLAIGSTIEVAGAPFKVRAKLQEGDGAITLLHCLNA